MPIIKFEKLKNRLKDFNTSVLYYLQNLWAKLVTLVNYHKIGEAEVNDTVKVKRYLKYDEDKLKDFKSKIHL